MARKSITPANIDTARHALATLPKKIVSKLPRTGSKSKRDDASPDFHEWSIKQLRHELKEIRGLDVTAIVVLAARNGMHYPDGRQRDTYVAAMEYLTRKPHVHAA
jgi:hypothetical protein